MGQRVLLVVHTTPWALAEEISAFAAYYNSRRYQKALDYVTLDDVYFGRKKSILEARKTLKAKTPGRRKIVNLEMRPKVPTNFTT